MVRDEGRRWPLWRCSPTGSGAGRRPAAAGSQGVKGSSPLSSTRQFLILPLLFLQLTRRAAPVASFSDPVIPQLWILLVVAVWSRSCEVPARSRLLNEFGRGEGRRDGIDGLLCGVRDEVPVDDDSGGDLRVRNGQRGVILRSVNALLIGQRESKIRTPTRVTLASHGAGRSATSVSMSSQFRSQRRSCSKSVRLPPLVRKQARTLWSSKA